MTGSTSPLVVTGCDAGYLPYLVAMMRSLAASNPDVRLRVLHPDITAPEQRLVHAQAPELDLAFVRVDDGFLTRHGVPDVPEVRRPHYLRCSMGDALPDEPRAIYVDADTVVLDSLDPLWTSDLGGAVLAAAPDYFLPTCGRATSGWRELGLDAGGRYVNTGVLVVDLEAWRGRGIAARVLQTCLDHPELVYAHGRWPQHDQFGVNVVLHGQMAALSQRWNHLTEIPAEDVSGGEPVVVHFCGGGKPGSPSCPERWTRCFDHALGGSAWAGWRPGMPARPVG